MYKIWIIDTSNNTQIYNSLLGSFSVSFFGSAENAFKVKKMMGLEDPDAVFVKTMENARKISDLFSDSAVFILGTIVEYDENFFYLDKVCYSKFSEICSGIVMHRRKDSSFEVCLDSLCLKIEDQDVEMKLSHKEALILKSLKEAKSESVKREELIGLLWGEVKVGARTLDSHISRLRKRIKPYGFSIESSYGSGYKVVLDA